MINVESVGGDVFFKYNKKLESLEGLNNLTIVNGNFALFDVDSLSNLEPLLKVEEIKGELVVEWSDNLINLNGLSNVTSIAGRVFVRNNDNLISIEGLAKISNLNSELAILGNRSLTNLSGLEGLESIAGRLRVETNVTLGNCAALAPVLGATTGVSSVGGEVLLSGNQLGCNSIDEILASYVPEGPSETAFCKGEEHHISLASRGGYFSSRRKLQYRLWLPYCIRARYHELGWLGWSYAH